MLMHSMTFGGTDLRSAYGIIIEKVERPFFAKLRQSKVQIPDKSGMFDYGAKYHDELTLSVKCGSISLLTQAQVRELVYELSKKEKIVFWNEPDKYYIGRLYDPGKIVNEVGTMRKFTLPFVCEPYAYGETISEAFTLSFTPLYRGSAETPARIEITNTGAASVAGVHITVTRRKENH